MLQTPTNLLQIYQLLLSEQNSSCVICHWSVKSSKVSSLIIDSSRHSLIFFLLSRKWKEPFSMFRRRNKTKCWNIFCSFDYHDSNKMTFYNWSMKLFLSCLRCPALSISRQLVPFFLILFFFLVFFFRWSAANWKINVCATNTDRCDQTLWKKCNHTILIFKFKYVVNEW